MSPCEIRATRGAAREFGFTTREKPEEDRLPAPAGTRLPVA
jgi:hypothetical protein